MSVRDIIEAATPGRWDVGPSRGTVEANDLVAICYMREGAHGRYQGEYDADYIAAFDPEHVALMEAVCEAAAKNVAQPKQFGGRSLWHCVQDLTAYRKERGLL